MAFYVILIYNIVIFMTNAATLFPWLDIYDIIFEHKGFSNVIVDRGSKYTVSWWRVTSKEEVKSRLKTHLADKYFRKATHNTYAFRIQTPEWTIVEWKNDDGETWAGQCILRELQRANVTNGVVVVTRYFWWTQLHADRFRHVIDATKIFLKKGRE